MLGRLVKRFDIFAAQPMLRVKGQSQVTNICGGFFSILISILFIYMFVAALIQIITYKEIEFSETTRNDRDIQELVKVDTFAIGIHGLDLRTLTNIFTVTGMWVVTQNQNFIQFGVINMVPCRVQMWADLNDPEYEFNLFNLQDKYCPESTEQFYVSGDLLNSRARILYFSLKKCNNATSPVICATPLEIQTFFDNTIAVGKYFKGCFLPMTTNFNTKEKEMTYKYINTDTKWLTFTDEQSKETLIMTGSYQVNTDVSFLPWQSNQIYNGSFIDSSQYHVVERGNYEEYLEVYIGASRRMKLFERKYGKIDDVLSYIGGLFQLIISFFGFFLFSFNQYRYQLAIAEHAFTYKTQEGQKITPQKLTFFKYIKYSLFDWIKVFCCNKELDWKDCQEIDEARQEGSAQIDVKYLLKRINDLEQLNKINFSKDEQIIAGLSEVHSIKQISEKRKIFEYTEKIMNGRPGLTIQALQIVQNTLKSMKLFQNIFPKNKKKSLPSIHPIQINQTSQQEIKEVPSLVRKQFSPTLLQKEKNDQYKMPESYRIVRQYLLQQQQRIIQFFDSVPELTEQDFEIQKKISESFSRIEQTLRRKMIKKIPLQILSRIMKTLDAQSPSSKKKEGLREKGNWI